jgi:acyl-coenzyme A synthetase/AMP-(fatty) acid ligase
MRLPSEQQAIQARCVHPTGAFNQFDKADCEQSISRRFEKMVLEHHDRAAVKTKTRAFSYFELNQTANRVARAIRQRCHESDEPVAVLMEHGAAMIIGLLAVFKTGKICVPLDPGYHEARVNYILEDCQTKLIITNSEHLPLARALAQNKSSVINIDDIDSGLDAENLALSSEPESFAYVLYTSGSTGQPKGVIQNHRNLLFDVGNYTNRFHICRDDRLTLFASMSGGEGMKNLFSALLNGATLCLWNVKRDGFEGLADWLIEEEISLYISTPTIFRNFISTLKEEDCFPKLRLVRLGSGAVHKNDVASYKRYFSPQCILINWLSSTEVGNFAHYFIDMKSEIAGDTVPVGHPAPDKQILLLDDNGQPIGFNQVGEIAVRSRYLSPGYWRRPELTRVKFLPDPEGRNDSQVKVRGYRIELAAIEMALLEFAAIKEAVVVVRQDQFGEQGLVAYLVPKDRPAPRAGQVRDFLNDKLPPYMVPSRFLFLDALPLNPNGKVDRRALPDPGQARPDLENPFAAPKTPVEDKLSLIWAEILSLSRVGVHDNFFDLGGDSVTATRVVSRVINTFHVEMPLQIFFAAPTVAEMGAVITEHQRKQLGGRDLNRIPAELETPSDRCKKLLRGREEI